MREIVFEPRGFNEYNDWAISDKKVFKKIIDLINNISRTPFEGIGKPEPLKHELAGYWSRRIDEKHRLVYKVTGTSVIVAACKYHY
ncbi:MAG: Txe/YoeB family addiction module toxin [Bacteroidia bacterium]|nr:Txe/YoeB family addiction module toxin [Bacteroidia bacterium]